MGSTNRSAVRPRMLGLGTSRGRHGSDRGGDGHPWEELKCIPHQIKHQLGVRLIALFSHSNMSRKWRWVRRDPFPAVGQSYNHAQDRGGPRFGRAFTTPIRTRRTDGRTRSGVASGERCEVWSKRPLAHEGFQGSPMRTIVIKRFDHLCGAMVSCAFLGTEKGDERLSKTGFFERFRPSSFPS